MYRILDMMLPHPGSRRPGPMSQHKIVASSPPWHAQAAGLVLELHTSIRRVESDLVHVVSGRTATPRGGTDANTWFALRSVGRLCYAADDNTTARIFGYLDTWINRAYAIFDDRQSLHRLPRHPGESEYRCPYCTYQTMRWHPLTGVIVCVNPGCRDDEGRRPRWTVAYQITGDRLEWSWEVAA